MMKKKTKTTKPTTTVNAAKMGKDQQLKADSKLLAKEMKKYQAALAKNPKAPLPSTLRTEPRPTPGNPDRLAYFLA